MKLSILTVITLLLFAGAPAFAQIPELERPQVTPPSPEAAELTKYITYPVNLSNGLVQMSIPLYEIVDGDIRIPITLNYHASGLKPNMRSGHWLGDGWSLSTGPSLSRTINGVADEINYNPNMALGGRRHIHQSLTFTGKPLRTRETVELPDRRADSLVTSRLYDSQERLVSETSSLNGKSQTVAYSYDSAGRLTDAWQRQL